MGGLKPIRRGKGMKERHGFLLMPGMQKDYRFQYRALYDLCERHHGPCLNPPSALQLARTAVPPGKD